MSMKTQPKSVAPPVPPPDDPDAEFWSVDDGPDLPAPAEALSPHQMLNANLLATRRRLIPIRRAAVQLPRDHDGPRIGALLKLVPARHHVVLDTYLLNLALVPITTDGDTFDNEVIARMLSVGRPHIKAPAVSRAWAILEQASLVSRARADERVVGRPVLLNEDGSGKPYTHPGAEGERDEIGYFGMPRAYWRNGFADPNTLGLPGKAMLLILLSETNNPESTSITLTHDQFAKYYGLSPNTVKRGLQELRKAGLLGEDWSYRPASRSKTGQTQVSTYWLKGAFSTKGREKARQADRADIEAKQGGERDE